MNVISRFLLVLLCLLPAPVWAASSPWQHSDEMAVRLISATEGTGGQAALLLGLDIQLAEGWHTYWRSPGDAGLPPSIDWEDSENLAKLDILYPAPIRYSAMGMDTVGYRGRLVLPLRATLAKQGEPLRLVGALDILLCKDICLPKHFPLVLELPVAGGTLHSVEYPLIQKALASVPKDEDTKLSITKLTRGSQAIQLTLNGTEKLRAPDMLIENDRSVTFEAPKVTIGPNGKTALFTFALVGELPEGESLAKLPITVTAMDDGHALERSFSPEQHPIVETSKSIAAPPKAPDTNSTILPFWCVLLLALAGGFILNLMPCVLPVLSLKLMSLIRHGGNAKQRIRHSFLSTAGGIVFSFMLLAFATIGLKATGQVIGWGVQFQQPLFLVFMIALLTFFAANLWGFFELGVPAFVSDLVDPHHHPKLAGDFATGALATLLATPCSAPFLGTAVAFAMAAGWVEILSVFAALGIGMSLPYLAVALWPRLASALPKPGAWMVVLSKILGFGLAATALWLLGILAAQMGKSGTVLVGLAMAAILFQLYLRHKKILRFLTIPVIAFALLGSCGIAYVATAPSSHAPEMGAWQRFNEETLARNLREGKTVFVDVTADWCLTCKVNKRFTMTRKAVQDRLFGKRGVVTLQADWTNPNPIVTAFLNKHGRFGIPFNIVFGPHAPDGIALPEILTPSLVIEAIDKAQGPAKACPAGLPDGVSC